MQLHKNTFTAQDAILESEENYLASVYASASKRSQVHNRSEASVRDRTRALALLNTPQVLKESCVCL